MLAALFAQFQVGQTIELLKSYVEAEFGISMTRQTLLLEKQVLLDPMTLLDYNISSKDEEVFITVEGEMDAQFLK